MATKHRLKGVCCRQQIGPGLSKSELLLTFWNERHMFFGYMRRFALGEDERSDIFQEACVRFLASGAVFHCTEMAAKYLYLTIRSLSIDNAKRAERLSYYAEPPEVIYHPHQACHLRMLIEEVRESAGGLSDGDRQILAAHLSPELPRLRDKCECLRVPSSTFRYRRDKAVRKLKRLVRQKIHRLR